MHESTTHNPGAQPTYRIGAAARLTGLSTHTLRKWEDRHGLVAPRRSPGGERLYSADDVKRLALVKDLVEGGMPLAELAALSMNDLEALSRHARQPEPAARADEVSRVGLAVLGAALPTMLASEGRHFRRVRIVASANTLGALGDALDGIAPDVVMMEFPTITADTAAQVRDVMTALRAPAALVVFGFGSRRDLEGLRRPDIALVRAPADATEIERLCLGLAVSIGERWPAPVAPPVESDGSIPPPRWSREALASIAALPSSVVCECPRHLADLIMSLEAFEQYSAGCENRDDKDRDLHRYLHDVAGTSRALLEQALQRVAEHEGLDLD